MKKGKIGKKLNRPTYITISFDLTVSTFVVENFNRYIRINLLKSTDLSMMIVEKAGLHNSDFTK